MILRRQERKKDVRLRLRSVSGEVKGGRHACFIFPRLTSQSQIRREIVHQIEKSKEEGKIEGRKGRGAFKFAEKRP